MRVADFIFEFIAKQGIDHVFFLPGGGAMHLNDGLRKQTSINAVSMLHEQGASIAAEGFARTSGKFGVCLVTSGPGATNAITGLAGAWFESTPVLFISGQVKRSNLKGDLGVRQLGAQELDIVTMVRSVTKYATSLMDPLQAKRTLQEALHWMTEGRPGPVWIEVPLDVQAAEIDPEALISFQGVEPATDSRQALSVSGSLSAVAEHIRHAERPVLLAGNGVHCSHAEEALRRLVERLNMPTLTTWTAADLLESSHPLAFGRPGTAAPRAANFTVQNADFVLAIGTRLDFTVTGFDRAQFARGATVVVVDIDKAEMDKLGDLPDMAIVSDAGAFIDGLLQQFDVQEVFDNSDWVKRCTQWRTKYPVVLPEFREQTDFVNSYVFAETLCDELDQNDMIIPGSSGAALDTFWLAATLKNGQRAVATGGLGAMGYGVPAAIGGCLGGNRRRTISVDGDGGFLMNVQELEVAVRMGLPIKFFVLNNNGYASIRASQGGYFKHTIGCDPSSGLTLPDIRKIARAFGIRTFCARSHRSLRATIRKALSAPGPVVCEVVVRPDQPIGPRVSSRILSDGSMVSTPLEDLFPFLDRDELRSNMSIPLIDDKA